MLVRLAWIGPPAPTRKLAQAQAPAQTRFAPLQEKKNIRHGYQEDPGRKVKVCRFQFRSNSIAKFRRCHGSVKFIRSS